MTNTNSFLHDQEINEYLEIFLYELQKICVEFSEAEKHKDTSSLQNIGRIIHSFKGSAGSCGLDFASVICHNIEESLVKIKETSFAQEQAELTNNLFLLLEDYFNTKKINPESDDEDFVVRLYALYSSSSAQVANQPLSGLRVLIVEESKLVAKQVSDKLNDQGIHCSFASNGLDAFNRLTDEYFDFLITGHFIKKINGFELIELLAISKGKNPNIKTCLITSADNVAPLKKSAHLVLQKNTSLIQNIVAFMLSENSVGQPQLKSKSFQKILLVDDDPVIRKLFQAVFAKETGLHAEIVSSGTEALQKVETFSPEVIVLDCVMPELSGPETFKMMKTSKALANTRFFFLTGKNRPEDVFELLSLGADGVLIKPFTPNRLVSTLREKYSAAA